MAVRRQQATQTVIDRPGGAPDLAAGSLEHAVRRRQHDLVGRFAKRRDGRFNDALAQGLKNNLVRCLATDDLAGLGQHDQPLGAGGRIGAAEDGNTTAAHAGDATDRALDFMRADVAAAPNDHVLDPTGQVDLAIGDIGPIARIEPVAVEEALCRFGIVEIARRRRRATELQPAFLALGQLSRLATGRDADGADVGQQVGVAQHNALGVWVRTGDFSVVAEARQVRATSHPSKRRAKTALQTSTQLRRTYRHQ